MEWIHPKLTVNETDTLTQIKRPQGSAYINYKALENHLEGLPLFQEKLIGGVCKQWKRLWLCSFQRIEEGLRVYQNSISMLE